jgi:predicted ATPase
MRAVITGGPSVGKTTIIQGLAQLGFTVVEEIATQIIKEGELLPWIDRVAFQKEVLRRQVFAEERLKHAEEIVFLDRGLFDGEAYYIYDKLAVPELFTELDASKYTVAFLVEPLGFFEANEIRQKESLEFCKEVSRILEECYTRRNVKVVRVPAMSPEERVEFVLMQIRDLIGEQIGMEAPDVQVSPVGIEPELKLSLSPA